MQRGLLCFILFVFITLPSHAFTLPEQRDDKVINNVQYVQWFMEGNGWEIRAYFDKKTDDLALIKLWKDNEKEYIANVRRVK